MFKQERSLHTTNEKSFKRLAVFAVHHHHMSSWWSSPDLIDAPILVLTFTAPRLPPTLHRQTSKRVMAAEASWLNLFRKTWSSWTNITKKTPEHLKWESGNQEGVKVTHIWCPVVLLVAILRQGLLQHGTDRMSWDYLPPPNHRRLHLEPKAPCNQWRWNDLFKPEICLKMPPEPLTLLLQWYIHITITSHYNHYVDEFLGECDRLTPESGR